MSLDTAKLEKVRELPGGIVQARCPACAEGGHDRTGEHLRIYPDGRFGCCVHPKDKEHRKRIFALAGGKLPFHSSGTFTLRLKAPSATPSTRSVKAALTSLPTPPMGESRTPRTGNLELRTRARGDATAHIDIGGDFPEELKDSEQPVRGVLLAKSPETIVQDAKPLPFLTAGGDLVIPFDSPECYHWWKPPHEQRQRVGQTLREVNERMKHAVTV